MKYLIMQRFSSHSLLYKSFFSFYEQVQMKSLTVKKKLWQKILYVFAKIFIFILVQTGNWTFLC